MAGKKISELPTQTGFVSLNDLFVLVDINQDKTTKIPFSGLIENATGLVTSGLQNEFSQINADISTLSGRIDGNDSDIQELQVATGNLENRSDSLDSQISTLENTTVDLFNSGVALENSTGALSTATGILEIRVSDLETSTGLLSTATGNLESDLSQIENNINNLQSSGTTFETQTGNLDSSIQTLQVATGNLDSDISILEGLTGGLDATGQSLQTATGEIAAITGSIKSYIESSGFAADLNQIIEGTPIINVTGDNLTVTDSIINKYVRLTNGGNVDITLDSGVGFEVGNFVELVAVNGSFTISGNVDFNYIGDFGLFGFSTALLKNVGSGEFDIIGGLDV